MAMFKHVFSQLLRTRSKFRSQHRRRAVVVPTENATLVYAEQNSLLCARDHSAPEPTVQDVQSSTDTLVRKVDSEQFEDEGECEYDHRTWNT